MLPQGTAAFDDFKSFVGDFGQLDDLIVEVDGAAGPALRAFAGELADRLAKLDTVAAVHARVGGWQVWDDLLRRHPFNYVSEADYAALASTARTFKGLIGDGAKVIRGSGDKEKQAPVTSFAEAVDWLMKEAESAVSRQRYKGLGEMNPEQLWETTMDPAVRRMLKVQIEDAIGADQIFTTLMGDEVEPRRQFIESNALYAGNIDV